jgi:hypothetical protein
MASATDGGRGVLSVTLSGIKLNLVYRVIRESRIEFAVRDRGTDSEATLFQNVNH